MSSDNEFDEGEAIGNFRVDHLYTSEFKNGAGKYFNIVTEDDSNTTVEYHPPFPSRNRVKLTVTFIRQSGQITEVTLKKFKQYTTKGKSRWEELSWGEPITFTHFTFEKLMNFLKILTQEDLANLRERRIALINDEGDQIDTDTRGKLRLLLKQPNGLEMLDELLRSGSITSGDLVNIGYRKSQLEIFKELLSDPERINEYGTENSIGNAKPETIWQHFFEKNEWIFGFGLDYRYLGILQREAHISEEDLAGRDGSILDFLMGTSNFTVLVEVKRPDTPLFSSSRNRSGSWKLSIDLMESVSQILEQKSSWQIKAETNALNNYNSSGELITQKTFDPKSILIIGSDSQFSGSDKEKAIKLRTFELFRRNSRNIDILTYDEICQRAEFVVGHSVCKSAYLRGG